MNSVQIILKLNSSSHQRCSKKEAILKPFVIFTGKRLCRGLFLDSVRRLNSLKKGLNSYIRANPQLLEKFGVKSDKKHNIFLHNSLKILGYFDSKHLQWSKTDLSK